MTPRSDHEEDMSMEEILASIRKFVTESTPHDPSRQKIYKGDLAESVVVPPPGQTPNQEYKRVSSQSPSPGHHSSASPAARDKPDVLELKNPLVREEAESTIMVLTNPLEGEKSEKPTRFQARTPQSPEQPGESLSSPQAVTASAGSLSRLAEASKAAFQKKATNLVDQRNLTLDQLIQDMVRPMIKQWIDAHLPSLVEDMVAKEINRITKHLN